MNDRLPAWLPFVGAVLVAASLLIACFAAPDDRPVRNALPDLAGQCEFGTVAQVGRAVSITGGTWLATGQINPNGTVTLYWTATHSGQQAVGVYRVDGRKLMGHWGWADAVEINDQGELEGDRNSERLTLWEPEKSEGF